MTKIIQSTLPKPEVSCLRKRSAKTVINQNQMTQAKKISIVQTTSRNG